MRLAKQEEEKNGIEVALPHGSGQGWWWCGIVVVACEGVERREEVACDEEGLLVEGECVEVVEG